MLKKSGVQVYDGWFSGGYAFCLIVVIKQQPLCDKTYLLFMAWVEKWLINSFIVMREILVNLTSKQII